MGNQARLERIASSLPETERVDIEEWGGSPSTIAVTGGTKVDQYAVGCLVAI